MRTAPVEERRDDERWRPRGRAAAEMPCTGHSGDRIRGIRAPEPDPDLLLSSGAVDCLLTGVLELAGEVPAGRPPPPPVLVEGDRSDLERSSGDRAPEVRSNGALGDDRPSPADRPEVAILADRPVVTLGDWRPS